MYIIIEGSIILMFVNYTLLHDMMILVTVLTILTFFQYGDDGRISECL